MPSARWALRDAGLTKDDVDGNFCAGDAPGVTPRRTISTSAFVHIDSTDTGGSSYPPMSRCGEAIAAGKCNVALITLAAAPAAKVRAARSRATTSCAAGVCLGILFPPATAPCMHGRDAP